MDSSKNTRENLQGFTINRRNLLRSGSAIGAGIVAPTGIIGAGLFGVELAGAAGETDYASGAWVTDSKHPDRTLTINSRTYNYIHRFLKNRSGTVTDRVVVCDEKLGSLTARTGVIRVHTVNSVVVYSHYTDCGYDSVKKEAWFKNRNGRRLHHSRRTQWTQDHDMDGELADPISTMGVSLGSGHKSMTKWVDKVESIRYDQGKATSSTNQNPFVNRGTVMYGHNDSTDERLWSMTALYGNKSNYSKYTQLASLYSSVTAAQGKLDGMTAAGWGFAAASGAIVFAGTMVSILTGTWVPMSAGILIGGGLQVGQKITSDEITATSEYFKAYTDYVNFVLANQASNGTW
jgi:hypothetical protein